MIETELADEIERQLGPHFQKYGCIGIDLAPHKWAQIIASLRKAAGLADEIGRLLPADPSLDRHYKGLTLPPAKCREIIASLRKASEDVREEVRETLLPFISHKEDRDAATDAVLPILARLLSQASGGRDIASTSTRKEVMPHSPEPRTSRSGQGPHNAQPQQVEASAGASPPQALMRKALEALEPFVKLFGPDAQPCSDITVIWLMECLERGIFQDGSTLKFGDFRRARAAAEELSAYLISQGQ